MKYTAFLFDMNGVLVDDEHLQEQAFREVLAPLGFRLTPEEYVSYFIGKTDKKGLQDFARAKHAGYNVEQMIGAKGGAYKKLSADGLTGYPGAAEFVKALAGRGSSLAIVTSSMRAEAEAVLQGLGLREYFKAIVAAEDINHSKPDPECYLNGAAALAVEPAACVVIEDAPSGVQAGKEAEMFVLAVTNTHSAAQLAGADILVDAMAVDLLEKL